ncbi:mannose-1-phosphate guanylyltransferase/mannose-6-phosphate isomerase [Algihabitans albus]|uniref:mannose-1-phosphate guanylyltransferase/mannose-6-phosphate isomerase n=1 Tax=Algihabitans albus TaxID=2164067 RepID=UPI000E5D7ECD|nr:mannose-1-phosphate guanylyltransferase/mannose-6-phosphate isomerase [Algihabitans albus]
MPVHTPPKIVPVVLSGGSGTRLWPLSRRSFPKQFADLLGGEPLFRRTLRRVSDAGIFAPPLVVCNLEHRFLVAEELRQAGLEASAILLEPEGRNTAPAAAIAALVALQRDPAAVLALLPADHLVAEASALAGLLQRAAVVAAGDGTLGDGASGGHLVTFGIVPHRPETGYGYIRVGQALSGDSARAAGACEVSAFVEKPDSETAADYLASGDYLWNSGMFVVGAGQLLAEMTRHCPKVLAAAEAALAGAREDLDFLRLEASAFAAAPSISLDYAVMERTDRAAVIPAEVGWHDLGAWPALWSVAAKDRNGNAVVGEAHLTEVRDSYLRADDGRLIAALGLEDMIVVSTHDALLVAPRARAAEIGDLAKTLTAAGRPEATDPKVIRRPWGSYETLVEAEGFKVKRIVVRPAGRLSLQYHHHRSEHWVVVSGEAEVTLGEEVFALGADRSTYVPQGTRHQLYNPGRAPLVIIEVQCGTYLGEDDIVRLADLYGRSDLVVSK